MIGKIATANLGRPLSFPESNRGCRHPTWVCPILFTFDGNASGSQFPAIATGNLDSAASAISFARSEILELEPGKRIRPV